MVLVLKILSKISDFVCNINFTILEVKKAVLHLLHPKYAKWWDFPVYSSGTMLSTPRHKGISHNFA